MAIYDSTNNGFSNASVVARRSEYPFWSQGDKKCRLIYDTVMVLETAYQPLALDTPHPTIPTAILVEETPPAPVEVGWVQYDRIYAVVGSGYSIYGSFNFEYPGVTGAIVGPAVSATITPAKFIGDGYIEWRAYLTSGSFDVGDFVLVDAVLVSENTTTRGFISSLVIQEQTTAKKYLSGLSRTYVNFLRPPTYSLTVNAVYEYTVRNRAPFNRNVASRTDVRFYWLPANKVNAKDVLKNVPIENKFTVYGSSGVTTTITETTVPNIGNYEIMTQKGSDLVANDTIVTQWRGNIYQTQTVYVKAL